MAGAKLLLGILMLTATIVDCQVQASGNRGPPSPTSSVGRPPTKTKSGPSPFRPSPKPEPQPSAPSTTSPDPLTELVNALTPILKTLAPVLKSLAPALKKLGPVLEQLLGSLLPSNSTTPGAPQQNPLGGLLNNLLGKSSPLGNVLGGLLGKGSPLGSTVNSLVGGLTGGSAPGGQQGSGGGSSLGNTLNNVVGGLTGALSSQPQQIGQGPPLSNTLNNVVGGLIGRPRPSARQSNGGSPLTNTLGGVVSGLTGGSAPQSQGGRVSGGPLSSLLGTVGSTVGSLLGGGGNRRSNNGGLSANVPPTGSVAGDALGFVTADKRHDMSAPQRSARRKGVIAGRISVREGALPFSGSANTFRSSSSNRRPSQQSYGPRGTFRSNAPVRTSWGTTSDRFMESCESACPFIYQPVCSTAGSAYDNKCLLECSGEALQCYGECPCYNTVDVAPRQSYLPCGCNPFEYDPVCTIDGYQIQNKCMAICQGRVIACSSHCPC